MGADLVGVTLKGAQAAFAVETVGALEVAVQPRREGVEATGSKLVGKGREPALGVAHCQDEACVGVADGELRVDTGDRRVGKGVVTLE